MNEFEKGKSKKDLYDFSTYDDKDEIIVLGEEPTTQIETVNKSATNENKADVTSINEPPIQIKPPNNQPPKQHKKGNKGSKIWVGISLGFTIIIIVLLIWVYYLQSNSKSAIEAERFAVTEQKTALEQSNKELSETEAKLKSVKKELAKREEAVEKAESKLDKEKDELKEQKNQANRKVQEESANNKAYDKYLTNILGGTSNVISAINTINKNFDALDKDNSKIDDKAWRTSMKTAMNVLSNKINTVKQIPTDKVTASHTGSYNALNQAISPLATAITSVQNGLTNSDLYSMSDANVSLSDGARYIDISLAIYDAETKELNQTSNLSNLQLDTTIYFSDASIDLTDTYTNYSE